MCKDVSLWGLKEGRILFNKDVLRGAQVCFPDEYTTFSHRQTFRNRVLWGVNHSIEVQADKNRLLILFTSQFKECSAVYLNLGT